jgi:hypothetical protein
MSMNVYCRGTAKIAHKETGETFKIEHDELDWQCVESHERAMGQEKHYQAEVDHATLGPLSWSLWEYPKGVQNLRETNSNDHTVIEDFDYGLEHEPGD